MPTPDLSLEIEAGRLDGRIICGVDEVGRGPLAGPVLAAAVVLPQTLPEELARAINDSKALRKANRESLEPLILAHARVGIGRAEVADIDRLNILQATFLAMARAVEALELVPDLALVDGNRAPKLPCAVRTVVKGDALCLSIAAASIVAKVARDRIMEDLARAHPGFGWERNAGYPTQEHMAALEKLGPTVHHRQTFAPVARLLAQASEAA